MPVEISEAATLPLLEPLSAATSTLLAPVRLFPNDYLHVSMDKSLKWFIVQAQAYRPYSGALLWNESEDDVLDLNGQQLVRSPGGPSSAAASKWLHKVPERRERGFGRWQLAATDFTALVIHHVWPAGRLIMTREAELVYNKLILRFMSQTQAAGLIARWKLNGTVPDMPADFIEHPRYPLGAHQRVALLATLHKEASHLFMEQGTGKTAVEIARICLEAARKRAGQTRGLSDHIYRALIVCPSQVRINWQTEFSRFATVPGKVTILRGDGLDRVRKLVDATRDEPDCAWAAAVINYESLPATLDALRRVPWDLMILDEVHNIKNHRTQRFKACQDLVEGGLVRQRAGLTGTPIANSVMDLWAQLEFLGQGLAGFTTYKAYSGFHGQYKQTGPPGAGGAVQKLVGISHVPLIQERLTRLAVMITKAEAGLNLPDKVYDLVEVEMTFQQAKWYRDVRDQLAIELEGADERRLTVDHVLTKLLRLAQITGGHIKWDEVIGLEGEVISPGRIEPIMGANPKLDALVGLLTEPGRDPNGKTIIWAQFICDIEAICRRLDQEGITHVSYYGATRQAARQEAVTRFNLDPSCRVFVGNPATAGSGLNLQGYDVGDPDRVPTYTDHEIFYSQGWSAILRGQAEDRAHRKGTRANVRITDLLVPGTVDEEIRKRVLEKQQTALEVQDVRDILRNVLRSGE